MLLRLKEEAIEHVLFVQLYEERLECWPRMLRQSRVDLIGALEQAHDRLVCGRPRSGSG